MSLPSQRRLWTALSPLAICGLIVGFAGCGSKEEAKTDGESVSAETTERIAEEPAPPVDEHAAQLKADMQDAMSLLENGDMATFIENYMPFEYVQEIRETTTIEEIATFMKLKGPAEGEWLAKLRALENSKIEFLDSEKSRARISGSVPTEFHEKSPFSLPDPATNAIPKTQGFVGDVQEAIRQAIATLETDDHRAFVENFFPKSELAVTLSEEGMQSLVNRFREHPEMVARMVGDLKAMRSLTPKFNAEQNTASFRLNPDTPQAREVRLERQETWRMADQARVMRAELHTQSQQPPIGFQPQWEMEWIRIRDHWRLSKIQ